MFIRGAMEQKKENFKMKHGACSPILDAALSDPARASFFACKIRGLALISRPLSAVTLSCVVLVFIT